MKKEFLLAFTVCLLFNSSFAFALKNNLSLIEAGTGNGEEETTIINNFSCSNSSLTPKEVQAFQEKILQTGFTGEEFGSGEAPIKDRATLENNTALLVSPDSNEAQKIELPNQEILPKEVSYLLNNRYNGSYSFGLLLDDTLRVGQCRDETEDCPLMGNNLTLRTDGEGFKEDFVSVWKDLKGLGEKWFGSDSDDKPGSQLPEETKQALEDYYSSQDEDELQGSIVRKVPGEYMFNSILTDEFSASMATNCRNSECTISLYSFFDKHFNQWFSANMVVQTGAPTLLGGAKKLVGLAQRRGLLGANFLDIENSKLVQNMRQKIWGPDNFFGKKLGPRIMAQKIKYDGFGNFFEEFVEATIFQKGMTDSGDAAILISKYMDPRTSPLYVNGKISIEKKKAFVKMIKDLKRYTNTADDYAQTAKKEMLELTELYGKDSVMGQAARTDYGAKMARLLNKFDDDLDADFPNMLASAKRCGLWDKGLHNIPSNNIQTIQSHTDQWNNIMKAFGGHPKYHFAKKTAADYRPGTFANWDEYETVGDGLQFYKLGHVRAGEKLDPEGLKHLAQQGHAEELFAKIPGGTHVEVRPENVEFILKNSEPGDIQLYTGEWVKGKVFQPHDMGDLLSNWPANRVQKAESQTALLWNSLRERNWAERKYFNAMDRIFANEERLAHAYFRTVGGAAKYSVAPYVYWQAKRGFGVEKMSAYMLPETWTSISYSTEADPIYDDAYIDFFAQAGSDQGDLFVRVINNLPWKYVLNAASEAFNPMKEQYDKFTKPDGGLRTKTGNIAVYSNTSENCIKCGITLASTKNDFSAFFKSSSKTSSIILEDTPIKEKKNGSTLINYSHHMNLNGVDPDGLPQEINLAKAIKDEKILSCQEAIEQAGFGVGFANELGINPGNYLALTEAAGYFVFGMGGAIISGVQQFVVASKLQDCVDTTEGYYTHYFAPALQEKEQPKADTVEYSTQRVADFIDGASEQMESMLKGTGTITEDAVGNIQDQLDSLSSGAKASDIVQATFDSYGFSRGMISGIRLFYFWAAGGTTIDPAEYKTTGKTVLTGTNGQTAVLDYETGQLIVDGEPVITSEDHLRMASTDLAIPAEAIPQTITKVVLSGDANELVFELKISSDRETADLIVKEEKLLDCIKQGVEEQTGLPLESDNLSEAFGKFQEMKTSTHSSVFLEKGKIIAEGVPRKVSSNNPGLEVYGDRSVRLLNSNDDDSDLGDLKAIYFDNGFVLYNPLTNEFIFWLKHHEKGKLEQSDVFGIKVDSKKETNPVTGCEEYVFDLSLLGDPDSPAKQEKVKFFNKSLENMGPFNIFKTDNKTYVFYADEVDCEIKLKIIDNETGEVEYDEAIDSITQTHDGFIVNTADGQTHDFGFSTEDGRPFLDYNGLKELLKSVSGMNGSLWYDPESGMWYAENAQLLPLLDLFRQQGIKTSVDEEGNVNGVPGQNLMNININDKTANNPFNLPSLPENLALLSLFFSALIACMLFTQFYFRKKS